MEWEKNIETRLEQLAKAVPSDNSFVDNVMSRIETSSDNVQQKTKTAFVRRLVMKNTFKFAAAAIVLIAAFLSLTLINKTVAPAYALEQTIKASHSVQYLHIKCFMVSISEEPIECWTEFKPTGQVNTMRIHKPAWMDPDDGDTVILWKNNQAQLWIKKKNFLVTLKDNEMAAQVLTMVEQFDPKNTVKNILQAQDKGEAEVKIEEPENKAEPIIITADSLVKNDDPVQRAVLFVDRATRLLNAVQTYQLKDGEYIHFSTVEFYDYNIPIDPAMFTFDNLPNNVLRINQTEQEIGLPQNELTDKEIAVELIRQFLEAMIVKDYEKAGRLWGGVPAERMKKAYGQIRFIKIISIGEPVPKPEMKALYVPCTIEIEEKGQISQWTPKHSYVRQVHGQPGRWEIIGGFRGI